MCSIIIEHPNNFRAQIQSKHQLIINDTSKHPQKHNSIHKIPHCSAPTSKRWKYVSISSKLQTVDTNDESKQSKNYTHTTTSHMPQQMDEKQSTPVWMMKQSLQRNKIQSSNLRPKQNTCVSNNRCMAWDSETFLEIWWLTMSLQFGDILVSQSHQSSAFTTVPASSMSKCLPYMCAKNWDCDCN